MRHFVRTSEWSGFYVVQSLGGIKKECRDTFTLYEGQSVKTLKEWLIFLPDEATFEDMYGGDTLSALWYEPLTDEEVEVYQDFDRTRKAIANEEKVKRLKEEAAKLGFKLVEDHRE